MDELVGKYSYDSNGNPRLVGYYELEDSMANTVPDDSPVVKLAVAILDDPHGISQEALEALTDLVADMYGPRAFPMYDRILNKIEGCDGRVYLPEDWKEA